MRAVQITRLEGPQAVEYRELDDPVPGPGEVLIEVHAAGVTFPDVLLTRGEYQLKPELPFIPGYEVAGVVRVASADAGFEPGDRVAAIPVFGGYAELLSVDARLVFPLPDHVSFVAGAGLSLNYLTVDYAFVRRGGLLPGETVLIHGAAGGVGTAGIQVAHAMDARVIAVVSTPEKAEIARKAGADEVVAVDGFRDSVATLTGGLGVDMVLDPVGGDRFTDSLRCLRSEGRLLVLGFTGGAIPTVKVNRLLNRDIDVRGSAFGRVWWLEPAYLRSQWDRLLPHIESGAIETVIGSTYPLRDAAQALRELDERRAIGKIVLEVR
ncbi:NADPH:quinone oxidoreductase family protein [Nocardia sp. NPDC046473]|uniref:NADPH:quinone oxidoreductase family protein n=1 Tax=Nocardia sp. NPDC046473 TaxID=3155733 RepID=UPI0033E28B2E